MSERLTLIREIDELTVAGDGRTLDARIVPYGVSARVADPPDFKPYDEQFEPGAFRAQLTAANRVDVLLNYEHRQGISDVIGRGVELDDRSDGLHGSFRVFDGQDGDKALELVREGVLTGMSAEFVALRSRVVDGVVRRVDARMRNVALCRPSDSGYGGPKAAYAGAGVLAVRTVPLAQVEPAAPMRDELRERVLALGVEPVVFRAVVRSTWNGDPARYTDEEYQRACLIDRGGDAPIKQRCSLPVLEPNGDLNVNALGPAAAALAGARGGLSHVTPGHRASAARKLLRYYRMADMQPPPALRAA